MSKLVIGLVGSFAYGLLRYGYFGSRTVILDEDDLEENSYGNAYYGVENGIFYDVVYQYIPWSGPERTLEVTRSIIPMEIFCLDNQNRLTSWGKRT